MHSCVLQVTGWTTKVNIIHHLFPITPVQLGPGFVIGVERVVTKVPGQFSLSDSSSTGFAQAIHFSSDKISHELVLSSFDRSGWLVSHCNVSGPMVKVAIPPDGFAVITRRFPK